MREFGINGKSGTFAVFSDAILLYSDAKKSEAIALCRPLNLVPSKSLYQYSVGISFPFS